jgi:hypothetical protein
LPKFETKKTSDKENLLMTTFKIERKKKGTNSGKELKDKNILRQKTKEREKECEKTKKRIERRKDKKKTKMNNLKEGDKEKIAREKRNRGI